MTGYKQKFEAGKITLYQADCMEMMRECPDKHFDLATPDPLYGVQENAYREANRSKLATTVKYHNSIWNQKKTEPEYFIELQRVSKNQVICGGNYFANWLPNSRCWLVWDKHTSGNFADCELLWTSFDSSVRKFDYPWNGMIQGFHGIKSKNEPRIHPTQKPSKLFEWILQNYAKPGDKIIDTHLGSGSSAIACYNLDYEFTGMEIDEDYFNGAVNRLKEHMKQQRLFDI